MKKDAYKLWMLTISVFFACTMFSCADEDDIDINTPTVNGQTAEKILHSAITEWGTSSEQVVAQMKNYNLVASQDGDFLMYSNKNYTFYVSYKFFNDSLYSTLVLMPEMAEGVGLKDILKGYSFIGVLDSVDVYLNEGDSKLACAYETVKDNATYQAIGFTPVDLDSEIISVLYPTSGVTDGHEWVDLGLPSGTLWATMNVGATSPEDYGDYFAWGEVTGYDSGKTSFSWSNYKYCNGSSSSMTKYCTSSSYGSVDNKIELELSDDAARQNWGGSWRMPSKEQFKELYDECIWTWTTQNGVSGYRVSSKKNSNSVFFPAAGYRYTSLSNAGSFGNYWSRSLYESYGYSASNLNFHSGVVTPTYNSYRLYGRSVRPVLGSK